MQIRPVRPTLVRSIDITGDFEDPAHAEGSEDEIMEVFRQIRDEIKLVFEAYAAGIRSARTE
jgi:protein-tyrosine-phosphatase